MDFRQLQSVGNLNLALAPWLVLFSVKESLTKALYFCLDDFVGMRAIELFFDDNILFKVYGRLIFRGVFATMEQNYLLTAIQINRVGALTS